MWDFKKNIYKAASDVITPLACGGGGVTFNGVSGIYERDIVLGTGLGFTTIDFDSAGIPDRMEIIYDGVVVADSLFVGQNLVIGGFTATSNISDINNVTSLPRKVWDGSTFVTVNPSVAVDYNDNHIADRTLLRSNGDNLSLGGGSSSIGVQPHSFGGTVTSAADGTIRIGFNKTTALPTVATIRITGVTSETIWNILGSTCPT